MKKFPEGFYWGAATSSYQVEGGIENTDWAQAARDGKLPVAGRAADHYHLYEQDFDIAKELGHNAHRFSVEWARIEPEEGTFDEEAIKHYRKVIEALHSRGLKPYLTLWHFTIPIWFAEKGGFENKNAPKIFARYAAYVTKNLGDLVEGISTINEPMVYANNGWLRGDWPPFKHDHFIDSVRVVGYAKHKHVKGEWKAPFLYLKVQSHLIKAHNFAYKAIKKVNPKLEVSIVKHVIVFHSDERLINRFFAWIANFHWTYYFMSKVHKQCDSIGLNYYIHKKYGDTAIYEKTDMNWDIYPEGIYDALAILWKYKKPLFVSEAGLADADDSHRAVYIRKQVEGVYKAIEEGIDVRGHMYWSLLDNYEWALGTEKRFGLVAINYDTLERTIRPSAWEYKKLIEANGLI